MCDVVLLSHSALVGRSHHRGVGLEGLRYDAVARHGCERILSAGLLLLAAFGKLFVADEHVDSALGNVDVDQTFSLNFISFGSE